MNIKQKLLTVNSFSRPNKKLESVKGIVVHWIGNAGTGTFANWSYFENLKSQVKRPDSRYASAHFIVGLDGDVIQCIPIDEMAYHVGAKEYKPGAIINLSTYPNNCTIGIELCHPRWDGVFNDETYRSGVELSAILLKQHNLNPHKDLYRHFDITGKLCPKYFVEHPAVWQEFKSDVERQLISIS